MNNIHTIISVAFFTVSKKFDGLVKRPYSSDKGYPVGHVSAMPNIGPVIAASLQPIAPATKLCVMRYL